MVFKKLTLLLIPAAITAAFMITLIPENSEPLLTNRISFDSKARYIRNLKPENPDLIVLGSSISLNNVNSDTIASCTGTSKFLNLSVWSLNIEAILMLARYYVNRYSPKVIITATSPVDFNNEHSFPDFSSSISRMNRYINQWPDWYFYLTRYNLSAISKRAETLRKYSDPGHSKSLCFDFAGGVPLTVKNADKNPFHLKQTMKFMQEKHYKALDELCSFLKKKNIRFFLVQSPTHPYFIENNSSEKRFRKHIERIKSIVSRYNHNFLDLSSNTIYEQDDFADNIHLQTKGAIKFTHLMMQKVAPVISKSN